MRPALGVLYVLVAPGYALQSALFPRQDDLDGIERAGLAVGLSIGVNPLLALILDSLPWGLRLWPMAISLALTVLVFSLAALARRLVLAPEKHFSANLRIDLKGWWAAQERSNRRLYGLVAGVLLVAILSTAAILILPKPAEQFTEFYILGSQGQAQDYPREVTVDQAFVVTSGIINHEALASTYNIRLQAGELLVGQAGPINLAVGGTWEEPLRLVMPTAGDDQQVIFILERDGQASPYRTLRLWLNVKPSTSP